MQKIECYEVMGHTDTTEGRGPMKVVARFSTYSEANRYVQSKAYSAWCVMGYQNPQTDIKNIRNTTIIIMDTVGEMEHMSLEELKTKALSKLTKEEISALGLGHVN